MNRASEDEDEDEDENEDEPLCPRAGQKPRAKASKSPRRVSEKHEIVQKVHFVFLRNTRFGESGVMLGA